MFTGQLNPNKIFASIFNMIISQRVFADNVKGTNSKLVDEAKVDGGMYGDTKLFYSTDVLNSYAWGNDAEAENLLKLYRPAAPKTQKLVIDTFRQIPLTVDNYLTKQAWSTEGAFGEFNSVMIGWMQVTKKVYDSTTYNSYIGTTKSAAARNEVSINQAESPTLGQGIGEAIANLMVDLKDTTRDFNDYGYLRSVGEEDIKIVWNSKYLNKIKKIDLPALFHNENLIDKFGEDVLPSRFFGNVNGKDITEADGTSHRSLVEIDLNTVDRTKPTYDPKKHLFPGDLIPEGTALVSGDEIVIPSYTEDANIVCVLMTKESVPFMSGFEVGTSFFNAKSLTDNKYLTWGRNTLEYLKDKPFIRLVISQE